MNKKRNSGLFVIVSLLMFFVFCAGANAATETFDVTEDTFINEAYPSNNYGSTGSIVVSNVPIDRYGFLDFEEVSLPEDAVVDDANLELYIYDHSHNDDAWVRIGLIGGSAWEEDEPKWDGPYPGPLTSAGNFVDINLNLSDGWKEVDVTDLVNKWLSGEKDQRGLYIYPNASNDFTLSLRSKEYGSNAAAIEVEYHIEEEEYEFELVSPEDEENVATKRPTFEWTEIDEDSDIDDYLIVLNKLNDDGDVAHEVLDEKVSEDEIEYTIDEDLEEGEYRWYVEALRDDESSIHKTDSWDFTVNLSEEEDEENEEEIDSEIEDEEDYSFPKLSLSDEDSGQSDAEQNDEQEGEIEKEKGLFSLDNFLFLVVGVAAAALGYWGFQEYKTRKEKKGKQIRKIKFEGEESEKSEEKKDTI